MAAVPQVSEAMATPATLVPVAEGASRTTFAGTVKVGAAPSSTVKRCMQVPALPQLSVAVQVRSITLVMMPGSTAGGCGWGGNGGCDCGGGSWVSLLRLPMEMVFTPVLIGVTGEVSLLASTMSAAMVPPTWSGCVAMSTTQTSTTIRSPGS